MKIQHNSQIWETSFHRFPNLWEYSFPIHENRWEYPYISHSWILRDFSCAGTCNLSCCFYWWNIWTPLHEENFIQFNFQEAATKSCFYPIIGDHLLCRTFKWLLLNYSMNQLKKLKYNLLWLPVLFTVFPVVKTLAKFGITG